VSYVTESAIDGPLRYAKQAVVMNVCANLSCVLYKMFAKSLVDLYLSANMISGPERIRRKRGEQVGRHPRQLYIRLKDCINVEQLI
jgi:hypothetical protein